MSIRPYHPRPWELETQGYIRQEKPPSSYPEHLLVGEDELGLSVVCKLGCRSSDSYFLRAIGVRQDLQGAHLGRQAIRAVVDFASREAATEGEDMVFLSAWVHERNTGSRRMFEACSWRLASCELEDHVTYTVAVPTPRGQPGLL